MKLLKLLKLSKPSAIGETVEIVGAVHIGESRGRDLRRIDREIAGPSTPDRPDEAEGRAGREGARTDTGRAFGLARNNASNTASGSQSPA
ncbi:hypothetical protein WG70_06970 [Burkholderia oklahomensis EO147]|nr:hypothetical protein WG70_06970 [Burkholderia oklahomensis EO147]KUY53706.1 hypothetical protein WG70_13580 [Burkholderia oklahomensis EO147]